MKKKIAYIIFIVILFLLFIWTNKLQTLWLFGMFGIIWLPMFFINRYNAGKIAVKFDIINELKEDPALLLEIENSSFFRFQRSGSSLTAKMLYLERNSLLISNVRRQEKAERNISFR